jgi:hypothetical protein
MSTLIQDSFTEVNAIDLIDHVGELGASWKPKIEYPGTLRILGGSAKYLSSNPLDDEALYVAVGGPAANAWQLKAQFVATGGGSGAGEHLATSTFTINSAGTAATATFTITADSIGGWNMVAYAFSAGHSLFQLSHNPVPTSTANATNDAASIAANINLSTATHGFSATSVGSAFTVTAPPGAWVNGWTLTISSTAGFTGSVGTFAGGADGVVNTLTINAVNVLSGAVTLSAAGVDSDNYATGLYASVLALYAQVLSAAVVAATTSPDYYATSSGNIVIVKPIPGVGAGANGFAAASTVTNVTRVQGGMGGGSYVNPDNNMGVCWCVQTDKKSFYRLRNTGVGSTLWVVEKVVDGVITVLTSSASPAMPSGLALNLLVQYDNGFMRVTLTETAENTTASFTCTDLSPLTSGYFGIWGSGGGTVSGVVPNQSGTVAVLMNGSQMFEVGANEFALTLPSLVIASTGIINSSAATSSSVSGSGGLAIGGSAGIVFPITYNIANDSEPVGGALFGGSAIIQEAIQYVPTGGVFVSGAGLVSDRIPFTASGGVLVSGSADASAQLVIVYPPSGGVLVSGSSPVKFAFAIAPSGGVSMGALPSCATTKLSSSRAAA